MSSLESKMLENIVKALAHHDATCPMPAQAILLSNFDHERFGWDDVKGVPVQASEGIQPERFRIQCEGSATGIEDALEEFVVTPRELPVESPAEPVPAIVPGRTPFDDLDEIDPGPIDPYRW